MKTFPTLMILMCAMMSATLLCGCGFIADKDLIKVAKIDKTYITRGDLTNIISKMDPAPNIRNRGDMQRVLEEHIDGELRREIGEKLAAEGKIKVTREEASAVYDSEHAEDAKLTNIPLENNPDLDRILKDYNLTRADLAAMKDRREEGIDKVEERLKGERATAVAAAEAFNSRAITITDEEFQIEYNLRKDSLLKFETIEFLAIALPLNAADEAARIMKRIDAGEKFEAVATEYQAKNPNFIMRSGIENNPSSAKLKGFWQNATGAEKGTVLGPVYLPGSQRLSTDEQGQQKVQNMPDVWLVLQVLDRTPATPKTLDEAKNDLAQGILVHKIIKQLRQQHGVEIYADKLRDPAMYGESM
ncbi:MAG: peptidyl-prolyl cis-trans isomerase [Candidatus Hydrogenedentes bacterium]|nr:peptidyl-prolyl cis-trans isomerase [Candidatus Hydrogenedentota bacterium]